MTEATTPMIVARVFDAPIDRVWDVHAKPEHLAQWMGPKGSTTVSSKMDFRVGGTHHYASTLAGMTMWGHCTYVAIDRPHRIALIQCFADEQARPVRHPLAPLWPMHMHSTTSFEAQGVHKTLVTVRWLPHEAAPHEVAFFEASLPGVQTAWQGSFDVLGDYLSSLAG